MSFLKDTLRARNAAPLLVLLVMMIASPPPGLGQNVDPDQYTQMKYRFVGIQGNRVSAVVGAPGNPLIAYAGGASGGVWKTTDGGIYWRPVFDDQPAQSIGSLAVAPSDPEIVWAGTGETFIRSNVSIGNGIYKSVDGGETWKHMGLEKSGRIGRIVIHPYNPDIVLAAAMGHSYGPQKERGIYRTTDGGETWEQVLFVDENTGCADIAMDPNNPRTLFAGMWTLEIKTFGRFSGGAGSGVFVSRDGGATWTRIEGHGLPTTEVGKIAVAVAQNNSDRVYALIETGGGGSLWRSDDGGRNWDLVSYNRLINERPHYNTRMAIAPDNYNEVYFPCNSVNYTLDGGDTIRPVRGMMNPGGDAHDWWIDPKNPDRMMVGNDGGVSVTLNRGHTWNRVRLPIAQMYHVAVDNDVPYHLYGNRQDGPSIRGPSNSMSGESIPSTVWMNVGGCESGFAIPDPEDSDIVWGGCYNGGLERTNVETGHDRMVDVWPENPQNSRALDLKYRFNWTFPIAISPHDHNKVYVGSQHVHMTTDGGQSWKEISPDLSLANPEHLLDSGGLTFDNLGVEYGDLVFAIAESPLEEGLIWAGTNDGQVQVTRDGGQNWTNVAGNIKGMPPTGTISNIEPSRYDAGSAYISVDYHQMNGRDPYIYKTEDYGQTWKLISSDIPKSVFSYVHCVREDPKRKGLLYAGTENAVYVSFNDGVKWQPLQNNLPHAPAHWLVVQEHFNDLVVATYGRGFYIMDDITPFQQLSQQILDADAQLFEPRQAYRFREVNLPLNYRGDLCDGENPPYGASINYYLKSAPREAVKITISDEGGKVVRTLTAPGKPGINRVWWDLRHEDAKEARLRLPPPGNPHVEFDPDRRLTLANYALNRGLFGPLVLPGTYTVKLEVDGKELSRSLTVLKDPHTEGTVADIRAQYELSMKIWNDINEVVDAVDLIESMRVQLKDLTTLLQQDDKYASVLPAAEELEKKLTASEDRLVQRALAEGDPKSFRKRQKVYGMLSFLQNTVGGGSSDYPPTTQQVAVYDKLRNEKTAALNELQGLLDRDIPAFNDVLQQANVSGIVPLR